MPNSGLGATAEFTSLANVSRKYHYVARKKMRCRFLVEFALRPQVPSVWEQVQFHHVLCSSWVTKMKNIYTTSIKSKFNYFCYVLDARVF